MKTIGTYHKNRSALWAILLLAILVTSCCEDDSATDPWQAEVERLKDAIAPLTNLDQAIGAGYDTDLTGYRTQMGHHYLKPELLDNTFELTKPEVLLFAPDANEVMQFVAVEYAVPIEDMDNPPPPPEGFTGDADVWEINTEFNVWTLHVWVGRENPHGIFAARNPTLP